MRSPSRIASTPAAYDAHYLALALRENCDFWTAGRRLLSIQLETSCHGSALPSRATEHLSKRSQSSHTGIRLRGFDRMRSKPLVFTHQRGSATGHRRDQVPLQQSQADRCRCWRSLASPPADSGRTIGAIWRDAAIAVAGTTVAATVHKSTGTSTSNRAPQVAVAIGGDACTEAAEVSPSTAGVRVAGRARASNYGSTWIGAEANALTAGSDASNRRSRSAGVARIGAARGNLRWT